MATAREKLLQALTAIISQPFSDDGRNSLNRLLNSYRVQSKPGEDLGKDQTARDSLGQKIITAWKEADVLDRKALGRIIGSFRMQLKQGLKRGKVAAAGDRLASKDVAKSETVVRSNAKQSSAKYENAYFQDKKDSGIVSNDAIAGGPKHKSGIRGHCPKCKSSGIVLARAYGGDEYYSCIYCGYQAYLSNQDQKLDLPLAAELLGGPFLDPDMDDD